LIEIEVVDFGFYAEKKLCVDKRYASTVSGRWSWLEPTRPNVQCPLPVGQPVGSIKIADECCACEVEEPSRRRYANERKATPWFAASRLTCTISRHNVDPRITYTRPVASKSGTQTLELDVSRSIANNTSHRTRGDPENARREKYGTSLVSESSTYFTIAQTALTASGRRHEAVRDMEYW